MKTKILLIVLASVMALGAWSQQPSARLGYWVVYSPNGKKETPVKTTDIANVTAIAGLCFPANCIDVNSELQQSPYYAIESYGKYFYVELKKVTKNGKYRKLSNREFRSIKTHRP